MIQTKDSKKALIASCLLAMLATILGAFAAHALKNTLTTYQQDIFHTGVFYQFVHSLALFGVGLALLHYNSSLIKLAGNLFLLGTILFSGSLYALTFIKLKWIGIVTPIGGLCFILGWLLLAVGIYTSKVHENGN